MIKLLIVDDERFIRETIASIIDWKSLGVEVIGQAADGIEAYNIILDEYPDIVMTDIKMPGLSGLELIQKIHAADKDTAFIILSGYDDFEYAKEAMKYGVRHYLLKPCNAQQIISCIHETVAELFRRNTLRESQSLSQQLNSGIFLSIFHQCLALGSEDLSFLHSYEKYLDFKSTPYELYYLFYLEDRYLQDAVDAIEQYRKSSAPGISFHYVYVRNTLTVFFLSALADSDGLNRFLNTLSFPGQSVSLVCQRKRFPSLEGLCMELLPKITRYETISYSNGTDIIPLCNYQNITQSVQRLTETLCTCTGEAGKAALDSLLDLLSGISDLNFLRQLASSILLQYVSRRSYTSTVRAAEFLMTFNELTDTETLFGKLSEQLRCTFQETSSSRPGHTELSDKIKEYIQEHLDNPDLSLKWISENYLYMNVDHISKRFYKETGQKFSNYLTEVRIARAKELLSNSDTSKIQYVAEKVGCGNNPQYFSQLFKRCTGMTPSNYIKLISGDK